MNTKTVAVINQTNILVIEDGGKLVPIKPICEALGIQFPTQKEKIEKDEILGSKTSLNVAVAADGKNREMFCIPLKYVFGWLFSINPANVKEEARDAVLKCRQECYDAFYNEMPIISNL